MGCEASLLLEVWFVIISECANTMMHVCTEDKKSLYASVEMPGFGGEKNDDMITYLELSPFYPVQFNRKTNNSTTRENVRYGHIPGNLSIHPSVHPSIHPSIHPSAYLCRVTKGLICPEDIHHSVTQRHTAKHHTHIVVWRWKQHGLGLYPQWNTS